MLPFVEFSVQLQSPQHRKDTDLSERDQRKPTEITGGMEHLSFRERLRESGTNFLVWPFAIGQVVMVETKTRLIQTRCKIEIFLQ